MTEEVIALRLETAESEIKELKAHIASVDKKFAAREQERQRDEKRRLYSALMFLGSVIVTLLGFLWKSITERGV